jgi:hypothetical protein
MMPKRATSGKTGINLKIDFLEIKGNNKQIISSDALVPSISISKNHTIIGDFNNDQVVDTTDYGLLMGHFPDHYLSDSWDPVFDINNDLMIDVQDVFLLSKEM